MSRKIRAEQLTERIKKHQYDMWEALEEIDRDRLYEDLGYKTQEAWALGEFGWTGNYLRRQLSAAKTAPLLSENSAHGHAIPTSERQIRPLSALAEPEQKAEAWQAAVDLANEGKEEDEPYSPPTAKQVESIVREMLFKETPALPKTGYSVILADPPWQFANSGFEESAASHYPTMATADICRLDVPVANVLFLWAVSAMLPDALQVMRAWGFEYKTNLVWAKDSGPSIGWFVRSRHELLLLGTRGEGKHPEWKPVSWFEAKATEHSRKPELAYEYIEKMYDGPYLEMFARRQRTGWEVWGNEV